MSKKSLFLLSGLLAFYACGGSSSSISQSSSLSTAQLETASSAVSAILPGLFGVDSNSNSISRLVSAVTSSCSSSTNDPGCTCSVVAQGLTPLAVTGLPFSSSGSFGSTNNEITISSADYCTDTSGNENTGSGPDGNGLFAHFTIRSDISGSCEEGGTTTSVALESTSAGVFRNSSSGGLALYGSFLVSIDGR